MTRDIQHPNSETEFEEPVFKTDEPETVFAEQDSYSSADDPVSAEPESSATDQTATANDGEDEYYGFEGGTSSGRQLGRTGPFWTLGGVGLLVIVALVWLFIFRDSTPSLVEATPQPTVPSPVATQVEATPTSEPAPTSTPAPVELSIGANVVVDNTAGEGIRLRNAPGLESITLAIIDDGTPFIVLDTDGEQENYPVEADGFLWYRVRSTINEEQEGWAASDFFVTSE